ncbi:MAG: cofactor-independent phosphoglycerate mutase [Oscillospiraceae bacterium]|nr:cofactor-independent phosphoglycerate mutase [Oscillospiraceae bacterium]
MKYILIIGDGMADVRLRELDGKTPLQYAKTPTMDKLASDGTMGAVLTIPDGLPAGSDTAILSIFGCDPKSCFTGRAPLEASALGIKLSPGDIAYRCNMVTFEDEDMPFEDKKIVSHSAGSIDGEESDAIIKDLFDGKQFNEAAKKAGIAIYPGSSFRHIAVQNASRAKNTEGTVLTPPHDHLGEPLGRHLPRGSPNAEVLGGLTRLAHKILDNHPLNIKRRAEGKLPANGIWLWAEGTSVELPGFTAKYGKTGGVISAVPLCRGIGALIGLDLVYVEGATGELYTNYEGKVDAAMELLMARDFAAIHIEAPDECTHNGDLAGKLQAIEWIDNRIVRPLTDRLGENGTDYRVLILSDHKTLSTTRAHDGSPVPYIIYDSRTKHDTGLSYCEEDAERGQFISAGTELMDALFRE